MCLNSALEKFLAEAFTVAEAALKCGKDIKHLTAFLLFRDMVRHF